jgi:hypothetical protein
VIAADTSSIVAYFSGLRGADVELIDGALSTGTLCLPPVVLAEVFERTVQPGAPCAYYYGVASTRNHIAILVAGFANALSAGSERIAGTPAGRAHRPILYRP